MYIYSCTLRYWALERFRAIAHSLEIVMFTLLYADIWALSVHLFFILYGFYRFWIFFLKNILLSSKDSYKYKLIEKTEQLRKRMKRKAFLYDRDNPNKCNNKNNNSYVGETINNKFKLKTRKCPPQIQDMIDFENNLLKSIENIQFRIVCDDFLNKLNEDILAKSNR